VTLSPTVIGELAAGGSDLDAREQEHKTLRLVAQQHTATTGYELISIFKITSR
jgi:hypothetical protein